jgi:hypothetical protein
MPNDPVQPVFARTPMPFLMPHQANVRPFPISPSVPTMKVLQAQFIGYISVFIFPAVIPTPAQDQAPPAPKTRYERLESRISK